MARGDVEKNEFVRALGLVARGNLHGVTGVLKIHEIDAFDDTTSMHVKTRNNSFGKHQGAFTRERNWRSEATVSEAIANLALAGKPCNQQRRRDLDKPASTHNDFLMDSEGRDSVALPPIALSAFSGSAESPASALFAEFHTMRTPALLSLAVVALVAASAVSNADLLPADRPVEAVIDHYVSERIASDEVQTAGQIGDENLIRRLSLDLAGRIPTTAELQKFLAADSGSRRAELVDHLLASPDFAFHHRN